MPEEESSWSESDRESLRDEIRRLALGESRFGRQTKDEFLQDCREIYIDDEAPEEERGEFVVFAELEWDRCQEQHQEDQVSWPAVTDCDRLKSAEKSLLEMGVVLWSASPCCDTCTMAEFPDHVDGLKKVDAGLEQRLRGYSFFIDQSMADMLAEGSEI